MNKAGTNKLKKFAPKKFKRYQENRLVQSLIMYPSKATWFGKETSTDNDMVIYILYVAEIPPII